MTTIITKIPGVTFSDATLPKLYRDPVIDIGTKIVVDGLDTYSWPKQAAPAQADNWVNLVSGGTNGLVNTAGAAGGVDVGFAGGGFQFGKVAGPSYDYIKFSGASLAAASVGLLVIVWLKHIDYTSADVYSGVAGCAVDGGSENQWTIQCDSTTRAYTGKANGVATPEFALASNEIAQIAISMSKINDAGSPSSDHYLRLYKNGAQVGSAISTGSTTLTQPSDAAVYLGGVPTYQTDWSGRIYRHVLSDLSAGISPLATVAADYAANVGRFS